MAEWIYVIGETNYLQKFKVFDEDGRVDLSTFINPRLFIQSTDFSTDFPTGGIGISIDFVENKFQIPVSNAFMPQVEDLYYSQIRLEDASGQIRLTFSFDLQVRRSMSS